MYINEIFVQKRPVVSFEVFPPNDLTGFESIADTAKKLSELKPDFISITYGAGGKNPKGTWELAEYIKKQHNIETLVHLTRMQNSYEDIENILDELQERGLCNILALRGDLPKDAPAPERIIYAKELIEQIKPRKTFGIAAAAYPQGHCQCSCIDQDVKYLAEKVAAGAQFLISQLFFDNAVYEPFMEKITAAGITVPFVAGIMPVFARGQLNHIMKLCGENVTVTPKLSALVEKYGDKPAEMQKAGIDYAVEQISDLIDKGIAGVHIYTMNKPILAQQIVAGAKLR